MALTFRHRGYLFKRSGIFGFGSRVKVYNEKGEYVTDFSIYKDGATSEVYNPQSLEDVVRWLFGRESWDDDLQHIAFDASCRSWYIENRLLPLSVVEEYEHKGAEKVYEQLVAEGYPDEACEWGWREAKRRANKRRRRTA